MSRLREIQEAFFESVILGRTETLPGKMDATHGTPLRSVALYRRLIRNNFFQTLKITYPVLHRLVGDTYFQILTRGYLRTHPSTSGDLFPYGRFVPGFLEELAISSPLPEIATLEWACHEISHAPNPAPLAGESFHEIMSADPARLTLRFHPASRLLFFSCPVYRLWHALRPDASTHEAIDLPLPAESSGVLVARPLQKVQVIPLKMAHFLLLEALYAGQSLALAYEEMTASGHTVDLANFLADLRNRRILVGFSIR